LKLYQDRGFEFVTLEEAQRDPFYKSSMDLQLKGGSSTLEGVMAERGLPLPPRTPSPQLQNLCR
jgi:peptidoglycan-N-acetylglucosamine deacetylase